MGTKGLGNKTTVLEAFNQTIEPAQRMIRNNGSIETAKAKAIVVAKDNDDKIAMLISAAKDSAAKDTRRDIGIHWQLGLLKNGKWLRDKLMSQQKQRSVHMIAPAKWNQSHRVCKQCLTVRRRKTTHVNEGSF